jgi:predicted amidohydrolase YtcJ
VDRSLILADVRPAGSDTSVDVHVADGVVAAVVPTGHPTAAARGDARRAGRGAARRIEGAGRVLLPGLGDAHVHVTQWALARGRIDCGDDRSPRAIATRLAAGRDDHAVAHAAGRRGPVLEGARMRMSLLDEPPHRRVLDAVLGDLPAIVVNIDLHTAWANTAALGWLGLEPGRDAPDDGLLREAACYAALDRLADVPIPTQDRMVADAMAAAASHGITRVTDFEFTDAVPAWQRRIASGRPPVRVDTTVYEHDLEAAITRGWPTGAVVPDTGGLLRAGHLKLFADGALNSGTAWCHEPAQGPPTDESGHQVMPVPRMRALVDHAWRHGIAPAIHAIGDKAVTTALDVVEAVGCPGRVEHVQLVRHEDVGRLARPGLVASVQPAHLTDDRDVTDRAWADRADRAWPLRSLAAAGARLVFGSDAPVSPLDPWAGIASAVTRTDDDRPAWQPAERLDRADALVAATGGRAGVHPGEPADLAVVDDDPLRCAPATLRSMRTWLTVTDGAVTHHAG